MSHRHRVDRSDALTWYVAHIVFGLGTIVALELEGVKSTPVAELTGMGFFAVAVIISWLWKMQFRHGPLEWFMRKLGE